MLLHGAIEIKEPTCTWGTKYKKILLWNISLGYTSYLKSLHLGINCIAGFSHCSGGDINVFFFLCVWRERESLLTCSCPEIAFLNTSLELIIPWNSFIDNFPKNKWTLCFPSQLVWLLTSNLKFQLLSGLLVNCLCLWHVIVWPHLHLWRSVNIHRLLLCLYFGPKWKK